MGRPKGRRNAETIIREAKERTRVKRISQGIFTPEQRAKQISFLRHVNGERTLLQEVMREQRILEASINSNPKNVNVESRSPRLETYKCIVRR